MSRVLPTEEVFHIQGPALAGIQRTDAFVQFGAEGVQSFDMRQQFAADLLLIGFG